MILLIISMGTPALDAYAAAWRRKSCGRKWIPTKFPALILAPLSWQLHMKLKKDDRWVKRTRLVWGLQPAVILLKNCRTFSDGSSVNSSPPKSAQNLLTPVFCA
jgi:hypothetical protein